MKSLFTKNILVWVGGLILVLIIALAALYHFDRFSFSATTGRIEVVVKGEQKDKAPSNQEAAISTGTEKNSVPSIESNKTEGAQSPIQHVIGGAAVNNYGTR